MTDFAVAAEDCNSGVHSQINLFSPITDCGRKTEMKYTLHMKLFPDFLCNRQIIKPHKNKIFL